MQPRLWSGISTREIEGYFKEMYQVGVSPSLISEVTDGVMDVAVGIRLLAARRERDGFLLAYSTRKACVSETKPTGSSSWTLRFNPDLASREPKPRRI